MKTTPNYSPAELTLVMVSKPEWGRLLLRALSVTTALVLCLAAFSLAGPPAHLSAAVPWSSISSATFTTEVPYVDGAYVMKDGSTYKMWYTHGPGSRSLADLAGSVSGVLTSEIIADISNHDLDQLLTDLSTLDASTISAMLNDFSTVIGYATSTDGVSWTVQNPTVVSDSSGGVFHSVGSPYVINDGGTYEMWYTAVKSPIDSTALQVILTGLGGGVSARQQAITDLMGATATAIYYSTSTDGVNWSSGTQVLAGSGGLLDSVSSCSVIKEGGGSYQMWFTHGQTSLTEGDLNNILSNLSTFGVNDLLQQILDDTGTSIGYATSSDGQNWTVQNPAVIAGTSAWDSVSAPCVLQKGSGYEMWYTRMQTDLDASGQETLIDDWLALTPQIGNLLTVLAGGDYDQFQIDLQSFIDNDMATVKTDLADTGSVITYATSDDGVNWDIQNSEQFVGPALWSSVSSPCVINDNGVYKIWFTQGMDTLSAQNMIDMLQGTDSTIGYATGFNLVAETSYSLTVNASQIACVQMNIDGAEDSASETSQDIPGGIASYQAVLSYDTAGIQVLGVDGVGAFSGGTAFDSGTNTITATASTPLTPSDSPVADIIVRLTGDATTPYTLTITYTQIMSDGSPGMNVPAESPQTISFLRGDTNGDGVVNIVDALFIAQYTVGIKTIQDINGINAACVAHDTNGDIINIVDALFIAQYTVSIKDSNFN